MGGVTIDLQNNNGHLKIGWGWGCVRSDPPALSLPTPRVHTISSKALLLDSNHDNKIPEN